MRRKCPMCGSMFDDDKSNPQIYCKDCVQYKDEFETILSEAVKICRLDHNRNCCGCGVCKES